MLGLSIPVRCKVRRFDAADVAAISAYAPEALIAPPNVALDLADQTLRGLGALSSLCIAVVVVTGFDDTPLMEDHRDLLWQAFGVPVYEQLRSDEGLILARECEVHDGMHACVEDLEMLENRFAGEITREHCECGAETPRLRWSHQPNSFSALPPRIFDRSASVA